MRNVINENKIESCENRKKKLFKNGTWFFCGI